MNTKTPHQKINLKKESVLNYILSESALAKDWLAVKEDNAWKNL